MNATEARKKTVLIWELKAQQEPLKSEIIKIYGLINDAINRGESSIECEDGLHCEVETYFKHKGFGIGYSSIDKLRYISW